MTTEESPPQLRRRERGPLVRWEELLPTALGAALAALLLSRLGVAGTIAGAACTPVIITITSEVVSRQIEYARERAASLPAKRPGSRWRRFVQRLPRGRRLRGALATAGLAVVMVAALITVAEAIVGKPVSGWGHPGGSGYTFSGGGSAPSSTSTPARTTPPPPPHHSISWNQHQLVSAVSERGADDSHLWDRYRFQRHDPGVDELADRFHGYFVRDNNGAMRPAGEAHLPRLPRDLSLVPSCARGRFWRSSNRRRG